MRKMKWFLPVFLVFLGLALGGCFWLLQPLQAKLVATPTSGPAPLSVTFSAAGSTGPIVSFTLDFETDGVVDYTGTDITLPVNNTYNTPGIYTATLTVADAQGRTASDAVTINVLAGTTASLSVSPNPVTQGTTVTFGLQGAAAAGRSLTEYRLWYAYTTGASPDLSGSISGSTFFLVHTYAGYPTAGTYTARLEIEDSEGDVAVSQVQVTVNSPPPVITNFAWENPSGTEVQFSFNAQAGGTGRKITKYTLSFGDTASYSEENLNISYPNSLTRTIVHDYTQTGSWTATLKVWDDLNQYTQTQSSVILP